MRGRTTSALAAALLTAAVATGCGSSSSLPSAQGSSSTPSTSSAQSHPTPGQSCITPGDDSGVVGLPACQTQAPVYPPSPTASPAGFHRLTYSHQPGPVPQAPTVTLTGPDGGTVGLTLQSVTTASGVHASIGATAGGKNLAWHTVSEGDNLTEAGFAFHIIKIWVMPTASTDAVDLTATPVG